MGSEPFRTFCFWAVIALIAGGVYVYFQGDGRRAQQRQRHATWRELCLRLELVPEPGDGRSASGKLHGAGFTLRDTGSDWLLEIPFPRPLLPPGVLLISAKARRLRPNAELRRLPLDYFSASPNPLAWYTGRNTPPGKVEAPLPFLEESWCAGAAHAPLRVEPHRLIHVLRAGSLLSVDDVRGAVRNLDTTAQRWLDAVGRHGLSRVEALRRELPPVTAPQRPRPKRRGGDDEGGWLMPGGG